MNQNFKVTLIGLIGVLTLGLTADKVQAFDFSFSGFAAGDLSASGTFSINDAAIPSGSLSESDIEDWTIDITNNSTGDSTTLNGTGGSFGATNSRITSYDSSSSSVTSSTLTFTDSFRISSNQGTTPAVFRQVSSSPARNRLILDGLNQAGSESALIANASTSATPVPFGTAPNTGILILGGMWGFSRLKKKISAKTVENSQH